MSTNQVNYCSRSLTKIVFRCLFNKKMGNQSNDFQIRLKNYNPNIIINAATSGLRDGVVKAAINEANQTINATCYAENHPSTW